MKKVIKNYLAKLQENDKKGFSLVELIIVMAIMACWYRSFSGTSVYGEVSYVKGSAAA